MRLTLLAIPVACSDAGPPLPTDVPSVDDLPELQAVEVRRIGSVDDPDAGFTAIYSVDVDRDDRIYVFDTGPMQVRVFSPEGEPLGSIGRRGQGPGEFANWTPLSVVGDTVWTFDVMTRRLTLFDRAGSVLETATVQGVRVPHRMERYDGLVMPAVLRPDGRFVGDLGRNLVPALERTSKPPEPLLYPRVLFDARGTVLDTVGWFPAPAQRDQASSRIDLGGETYLVPTPAPEGVLTMALWDGDLLVEQRTAPNEGRGTFAVTRRTLAGDTVYHHEYGYRPLPFTAAQLDSLARFAPRLPRPGEPPDEEEKSAATVRAILRAMDFPGFQLPIAARHLSADGGFWLRREDLREEAHRWVVFGPDGLPRGMVRLERALRPWWSRGDEFLIPQFDELGVSWLVRYRLVGS